MAYIDLQNELPGIRGLMAFSPKTAKPLNELAETLLRDPDNDLSRGERELIGAYVSHLNDCFFCQHVHGALAGHYLNCNLVEMDELLNGTETTLISNKLKALLPIAAAIRISGKKVTQEQIDHAREAGATDREIHDTVLIAAAFCMFNRYVDGLNTWAPDDPQYYINRAPARASEGYINFNLDK